MIAGPRPSTGRGWSTAGGADVDCVPVGDRPALHPLHVRHDRQPKGIVRDNGGHAGGAELVDAQHLRHALPGEVFWAASDVGWVVGHSYIVYGAAAERLPPASCSRASRSARPMPATYWRVIAEHGVSALFTAPTAFRAIKKEDPDGTADRHDHDLSSLRGRCSSPARTRPTPTRSGGPRTKLDTCR